MTLLTAVGTLVSWSPSLVETTTLFTTFHTLSSNPTIRIVSVSCCTLCPRLDGPSDLVNEREIRSGITVVTLLSYTCKELVLFLAFTGYDSVFVQLQQILSLQIELLQDLMAVFF